MKSIFRTISVEEGRTRVVQKGGLNFDSHSIFMDSYRSSAARINLELRELGLYSCTLPSHCLVLSYEEVMISSETFVFTVLGEQLGLPADYKSRSRECGCVDAIILSHDYRAHGR